MPKIGNRWVSSATRLSVFLAAAMLFGCGGGEESSEGRRIESQGVIAACLDHAGASRAKSTGDLAFLDTAEAKEAVQKIGLIYDKSSSEVVRMWTAATFEKRPPEWAVWFGQPLDSDLEPGEIAEKMPQPGFVMFVNHPKEAVRVATSGCFRIREGGKVNLHQVHPE